MTWRMTYENVGAAACSARGIAHRETKEELEALAKVLGDKISDVKIELRPSSLPKATQTKLDSGE